MISFLRHLFVPHHSNNHRPKLLHHKSLFVVILLVLVVSGWTSLIRNTTQNVLGIATDISTADLLSFTNQKRQEEGLPQLVINSELVQAAGGKASDMFAKNYWAHNGPDGTTPWSFFRSVGYNYIYAGENLAKDFNDSQAVVNAWMASPSHKENMLSPKYDEIGFAIVNGTLNGSETTLVVEMLGKRQKEVLSPTPLPIVQEEAVSIAQIQPTVTLAPTPTSSLTPTPSLSPKAITKEQIIPPSLIAGVKSEPLINTAGIVKPVAVGIVIFIILAFILDLIYIERRKIVRLVGHNSDHIIFLAGAIGFMLIIGKGIIL